MDVRHHGSRRHHVLRILPTLVAVLTASAAVRAGDGPVTAGLRFAAAGLDLERDTLYPRHPDPGKFRRDVVLSGAGGGVYLMAWELDRLSEAEWFERAVGPVLQGSGAWEHAWLPGADIAAVVEVPGSPQSRAVRVYAVRLGGVGVAVLCHGVEDPALSGACDAVAGSLEVRP